MVKGDGMDLLGRDEEILRAADAYRNAQTANDNLEARAELWRLAEGVVPPEQLRGAVDVAHEIRAAAVGVRARFGEHSGLATEMDRWAATLDPSGGR